MFWFLFLRVWMRRLVLRIGLEWWILVAGWVPVEKSVYLAFALSF